jgi:hypothetical protein
MNDLTDLTDLTTLDTLVLQQGSHETREAGMCAMEAVAWLAGEPHSDHPQCACPVISRFIIRVNDRLGEDARNRLLKPFLRLLVGSKATREVEIRRGFVAADYAVRVFVPARLSRLGKKELADRLRSVGRIDSEASARAARVVAEQVYTDAASAASYAAYAASAASYAAAYAAYAAASAAAYAAASAAASAASYAAAYAAASAAASAASAAAAYADAAADAAAAEQDITSCIEEMLAIKDASCS